jgi:hypothetical protein
MQLNSPSLSRTGSLHGLTNGVRFERNADSNCSLAVVRKLLDPRVKCTLHTVTFPRRAWLLNARGPARKLYRPSDRRFSAKLAPTIADRGCHVIVCLLFSCECFYLIKNCIILSVAFHGYEFTSVTAPGYTNLTKLIDARKNQWT